jgi:hypothetical protein
MTDMIPDLDDTQDISINFLLDQLNKIRKLKRLNQAKGFWDYVGYIVLPLIFGCVLLTLWVIFCGKKYPSPCEAMAKIRNKTDTVPKVGENDAESITKRAGGT